MELDHDFTVPVPVDQAWPVLLDVERVATCMPGATLDSAEGDEYKGRLKVKVGAMTITYRGTARIVSADESSRTVTLEASGKEARGSGTASSTVQAKLHEEDGTTRVTVHTKLNVTGRPAQFGRNILSEVGAKLVARFAKALAAELESSEKPPAKPKDKPTATEKAEKPAKAKTSEKPTEPKTSEKPAEPKASEKPTEPKTSEKAAEPKTSEKPTEPKTSEKPTEPKTSEKPAEPKASEKAAEPETSEKPVEPEAAEEAVKEVAEPEARDEPAEVEERAESAAPVKRERPLRVAREEDAIDMLELAGPSVAKRAAPAVGGLVAALVAIRLVIRRRRKKR
ncbi:carbon monoxide dehydrogenase subunit G [Actinomadura pelletieri DSM 43383]|uniref:Carbon monoxide dehydrogenase subunit G n=1 Tax=Actinomadura pelletieri DSM 43383 TaxID=1120940 RepID=A0A495QRT9_9ACTN|nr:SRPBCC family protein [Actinomadura pelletieri]RKS76198.1 carbon monoxide dehydrogenase subunit G [Actinomadura pelletieri DSM 43383]